MTIQIDEKEILDKIDNYLDKLIDDFHNEVIKNIIDMKIVNTGNLLRSVNIERNYLSKELIIDTPYVRVIEFGRMPGSMPPVDRIKEWVLQKKFTNNEKEAKRIAWAISIDIKNNGLRPRPFFKKSINNFISKVS